MMMNWRLHCKARSLIVLFALLSIASYSQDSLKHSKLIVTGYVKDLETIIFQDVNSDWTTSNLIHNRLNFKWSVTSSVTASLELRNRFLFGNMLTNFPGYNKTFETDKGIVSLSKNLIDEKSYLLNTTIDRLWVQYSNEKFQVIVGRQRINWGQTFVWNPNDIFNTYSYFDFDYEEKPGSDAVRFQYYSTPTSVIEFAAKENSQKKATLAGLYRFNKWNYDIQFVGGIADEEDFVIGTGWSGQVLKGGFRGEATYFHRMKEFNDTTGIFLASVSYDYTFKNSLFLQLEALYNGNNQSINILSLDQLNSSNINTKNLFLSGYSMFASLTYPITPLVSGSLAGITNFRNKLFFINPTINISLKENLELSFIAQLVRYYEHQTVIQDVNFIFARLKGSF
jgi:hypothetical protein